MCNRLHKHPVWRGMALVGLVCLLAGCRNIQVKLNPAFDQSRVRKIAVLEFDHPVYKDDVADSVTFGQSTSSNSGDIVADILTTELEDAGITGYSLMPRDRLRVTMRRAGRAELGEAARDRVGVGQLLGVDSLVVGKVERFQAGFFLLVSAATVSYTARCINVETGEEAWAIKGKLTRSYDYEDHVAALISHEAVRQLRESLQPSPPPVRRSIFGKKSPTPSPAPGK